MNHRLLEALQRHIPQESHTAGVAATPVPGLTSVCLQATSELTHAIAQPLVCLVLQGSKHVAMGAQSFQLEPGDSLLITADVPIVSQVTRASMAQPYIALAFELDLAVIAQLSAHLAPQRIPTHAPPYPHRNSTTVSHLGGHAGPISTQRCDAQVADVALRFMHLIEHPAAIPALHAPLTQELHYWLLAGRHGDAIRQLGRPGGRAQHIARAVSLLRAQFMQPLPIDRLADVAGMSVSSFHAHFRAATSLSPLQFQKQLRLIEAKRLMTLHGVPASSAAFAVGYESVPQFTREYGRMFGQSPAKDAKTMLPQRAVPAA